MMFAFLISKSSNLMPGDQKTRKVVYAEAKDGGESWPNGITLDFDAERIYWIDARSDSVNTVRYDGSDPRVVLRGGEYLSHPFSVALFESHVFWTDWRTGAVVRAGKFDGSDVRVEDRVAGGEGGGGQQPYDIRVMHRSRQPRYVSRHA